MNQPPQFPPPNGQPPQGFTGPPQGGFAPPPGQQQQFQGPPQGGFAPPLQFQGPPQTVNGNPALPSWSQSQGAPPFQAPQQPQQFQQQPQAPQGPPQFAPPGQGQETAKGPGRPKGAKNKNKALLPPPGDVSRANAYSLLSQGFAMLAACEESDEE